MTRLLRKHSGSIIAGFAAGLIASGGPAIAIIANAHKVDGYHANQLVRLAEDHTDGTALSGTSGVAAATTIAAPKRGYLFMVASSDVSNFVADEGVSCMIFLNDVSLSSSLRQIELTAATNAQEDCSTNAAWPVAKGMHKVELRALGIDFASTTFGATTLDVIYLPFNKAGQVPTAVPPT